MAASLSQKLQLKPGQAFTLLNAPENYADQLAAGGLPLAEAVPAAALMPSSGMDELLRLTPGHRRPAGRRAVLDRLPQRLQQSRVRCEPRHAGAGGGGHGLAAMRQIALDEVWSALRFRPPVRLAADRSPGRTQPPCDNLTDSVKISLRNMRCRPNRWKP